MSNLQLSRRAEIDLDELYDYIARHEHRPATADRVVQDLVAAMRRYADIFSAGSDIGALRDDLGEGYRTFAHKRWVIVFRPVDVGIEIMRVVDGSRDWAKLFDG
jgi:toxin ParE1/3/4